MVSFQGKRSIEVDQCDPSYFKLYFVFDAECAFGVCVCVRVVCMGCGQLTAREKMQQYFAALNPGWEASAGEVAPDGDVLLADEQVLQFRVPSCQSCGGILKPAVTFFGDTVDRATVQFVHDRLAEADSVLVAGSSLQVIT